MFSCMDHETLKHYIAGFHDYALSDPGFAPAEFLIYFAGNKSLLNFCRVLEKEQVKFLLESIDWLIRDEYYGDEDRQRYLTNKDNLLNQLS